MGHAEAGKSFMWILERMAMDTGNAVGNAGKSLQKLATDYSLKTLETQQREVLAKRKLALGPEHPDTLIAVGNLARTLADQGKHAEAEEMEIEVFIATHKMFVPEQYDCQLTEERGELDFWGKIAKDTGDAVGDAGKGLEKLTMDYGLKILEQEKREVLANRKRVLGGEHPDTLVAADNLARTLAAKRRVGV
jgi:hypothetical protein